MSGKPFNHLAAPLWMLFAERNLLFGKAIELLRQIDSKGSLSKAAESVPISYKAAWDLIDKLNNLSIYPVVIASTGGRNGGGTKLSEYGRSLLSLYNTLERAYENVFSSLEDAKPDMNHLFNIVKGLYMKTSARNQLAGFVKRIVHGSVNSEIVISIDKDTDITAVITNDSCDELSLREGLEVIVLVKAPAVFLFDNSPLKCSLENILNGKIVEIRTGTVNGEVLMELPGGKILTSIVSMESIEKLGISDGSHIQAAFSSSQVIIALPL